MKIQLIYIAFMVLFVGVTYGAKDDSRFPKVDGSLIKGQFVDLNDDSAGKVFIRYAGHTDSGVEVTRRTKDGSLVWRFYVKPLMVAHSSYKHVVSAYVGGGKVFVTSKGFKTIKESIDLASGKQISRTVSE